MNENGGCHRGLLDRVVIRKIRDSHAKDAEDHELPGASELNSKYRPVCNCKIKRKENLRRWEIEKHENFVMECKRNTFGIEKRIS